MNPSRSGLKKSADRKLLPAVARRNSASPENPAFLRFSSEDPVERVHRLKVEIINTGSELMLGRVLNSHQQWLCRRLADLGYPVTRQVAVSDTSGDIATAVEESLSRADLIITTGGLGPTSDDLTRDAIAALVKRPLYEDPATVAHIESFFARRKRAMPASTRVQAMIPQGAIILTNANGTAPGLAIHLAPNAFRTDGRPTLLVMLPGPPRELHPMFFNQVVPLLAEKCPPESAFHCRTLKTHGLGESQVEERIAAPLADWLKSGGEIGYCARVGEVEVRLTSTGPEGAARVAAAEKIVRDCLGDTIYGSDEELLHEVVVKSMAAAGKKLAIAESCTGGAIANRITSVPGASEVLLQGWITYSNASKSTELAVDAALIEKHGAVSAEVAVAMAAGAKARSGADFAISVTGIAGPGGGTAEKPVGTVFIGLACPGRLVFARRFNSFDRETFKFVTSQQALDLLRRAVLGGENAVLPETQQPAGCIHS